MKILFYTPFYPPQAQAAAVRCYWLIRTLKEAGHEVDTYSSIASSETKKLHFNPADNKQSFLKRMLFEILAGWELFFRILFSRQEMIILSSPPFLTIAIAHLAARLKKQAYLLDIRDIYPDVYFAQGLLNEKSFIGELLLSFTRSMYERSLAVMSVTPGLVQKIKVLAPKARKVELLINGYDAELFKPSVEKYEKFTVMFHGNMGRVQNLQTILDVAKKLELHADIEFVFIGEGPQAELLKASPLKNIKYLGSKLYSEIPQIISKAHVGFSARRDDEIGSDAIPVKAFEYLGVGIPVILTPKSGILTQMVNDGLYEFSNQEVDEIAAHILRLKETSVMPKLNQDLSRQSESKKILSLCQL